MGEQAEQHFAYYVSTYGTGIITDVNRYDDITADFDNIQSALLWGFTHQAKAACDLVINLSHYLRVRQTTAVHQQLIKAAFEAAERIGYISGQANTLQSLGDVSMQLREFVAGQGYYGRALRMYEAAGDGLGQANVLRALGGVSVRLAEFGKGQKYYKRALRKYKAMRSQLGQANTLLSLGEVSVRLDQFVEGQGYYERALRMYKTMGSILGQANTLKALGDLYSRQVRWSEAIAAYEQALDIARAIKYELGMANILYDMGLARFESGDEAVGIQYLEESAALYEAIKDQEWERNAQNRLSELRGRRKQ